MEKEIREFVTAIGATVPKPGDEIYVAFKRSFKRPNYFLFRGTFLIVKISRSPRPFWDISRNVLNIVNDLKSYHVVLLTSEREGWVLAKADVNVRINSGRWALAGHGSYKINMPLEDRFSFSSPSAFIAKLGFS